MQHVVWVFPFHFFCISTFTIEFAFLIQTILDVAKQSRGQAIQYSFCISCEVRMTEVGTVLAWSDNTVNRAACEWFIMLNGY